MMENNLRKVLKNLEMVIRNRKVIKVSLLLCAILSIIFSAIILTKLDSKPDYDSTYFELFNVAKDILEEDIEVASLKDSNYTIKTKNREIRISKNDNSLASILGIEPKVCISIRENDNDTITRSYPEEKYYNKTYYTSVVTFMVFFLAILTLGFYCVEIMIAFMFYIIFTLILNFSLDVKIKKRRKNSLKES